MNIAYSKWKNVEIQFKKKKKSENYWYVEGFINLLVDDFNIIHDVIWNIKECTIDVATTDSWFEKMTKTFQRREDLFDQLNKNSEEKFIQIGSLKNRCKNTKITLKSKQLETLNNYLYINRDLTIKGVLGLIKGSNPSGGLLNPKADEIVTFNEHWPFAILVENLRLKRTNGHFRHENWKTWVEMGKEEFDIWIKENKEIYDLFKKLSKPTTIEKDYKSLVLKFNNITKNYKTSVSRIKSDISSERAKYTKEINKVYKEETIWKTFNFKLREEYEYAHIKSVSQIKEEIKKELILSEKNNEKIKSIIKQVSDCENFLPLPLVVHKLYDSSKLWYTNQGKIKIEKNLHSVQSYLENRSVLERHNLNPLPSEWLTEQRVKYINEHNMWK